MLILTLRTDKPEAEIGLFEDEKQLAYETWQAHRQLAETIHIKIEKLLKSTGKVLDQLEGLVVYEGPGSFTGLRIGLSVANVLAYSFNIPIIGSGGEQWATEGVAALQAGKGQQQTSPVYGAQVHTTAPRK